MTMVSYAQNREDVLLARVFAGKRDGFFVDIGANDPIDLSVTKYFSTIGWTGVNVEPVISAHAKLQQDRTRDVNLNLAIGITPGELCLYELCGQDVLSTLSAEQAETYRAEGRSIRESRVQVITLAQLCEQYVTRPIDFMSIDVEGYELQVIASGDWQRFRPQVLLVESTLPNTQIPSHHDWEPLLLNADYIFAYFDGLNRFYVAKEHADHLKAFRVPVNICDDFIVYAQQKTLGDHAELIAHHEQLVSNFTELRQHHEELIRHHLQLQQQHEQLVKNHVQLSADSAQCVDRLMASNRDLLTCQSHLARAHADTAEVRAYADGLNRQLLEAHQEIHRLIAHIEEHRVLVHRATSHESELQQQLAVSQQALQEQSAQLREKESQLREKESQLREKESQLAQLANELSRFAGVGATGLKIAKLLHKLTTKYRAVCQSMTGRA